MHGGKKIGVVEVHRLKGSLVQKGNSDIVERPDDEPKSTENAKETHKKCNPVVVSKKKRIGSTLSSSLSIFRLKSNR